MSNLDFWSRYYYRCHELDEEEARRTELMRRADEVQGEKEIGWDEGLYAVTCEGELDRLGRRFVRCNM